MEITAEQEKLRDPEGFAAIKELHRLMDDDQSGSIDRFESADVSAMTSINFEIMALTNKNYKFSKIMFHLLRAGSRKFLFLSFFKFTDIPGI